MKKVLYVNGKGHLRMLGVSDEAEKVYCTDLETFLNVPKNVVGPFKINGIPACFCQPYDTKDIRHQLMARDSAISWSAEVVLTFVRDRASQEAPDPVMSDVDLDRLVLFLENAGVELKGFRQYGPERFIVELKQLPVVLLADALAVAIEMIISFQRELTFRLISPMRIGFLMKRRLDVRMLGRWEPVEWRQVALPSDLVSRVAGSLLWQDFDLYQPYDLHLRIQKMIRQLESYGVADE